MELKREKVKKERKERKNRIKKKRKSRKEKMKEERVRERRGNTIRREIHLRVPEFRKKFSSMKYYREREKRLQ